MNILCQLKNTWHAKQTFSARWTSACGLDVDVPSFSRRRCSGHVGLKNHGATCYMSVAELC